MADILAGALFPFDPDPLQREGRPVEIRGSLDRMLGRGDALWILDQRAGVVTRLDAVSHTLSDPTSVGDDPTDIAIGLEAVWVGDLDGSLYRVDASTFQVQEFPVGAEVLGVAVDEDAGSVWVYVGDPVGQAGG